MKQEIRNRMRGGWLLLTMLFALAGVASARADNPKITMVVAKRGTMVMELYPNMAPKTVAHILELVKQKFYDGIKIHRVVNDFVVQWGDPESKKLAPAEFEANGVGSHDSGHPVPLEAKMLHEKYTLGLARSQSLDSGDCQIFINLKANHNLDAGYCAFGKIIKGANLADQLAVGDVITSVRKGASKDAGKEDKKK